MATASVRKENSFIAEGFVSDKRGTEKVASCQLSEKRARLGLL
jgi:hypothetical protein